VFAPGYYKTNYRALRFRELVRMRGLRRAFKDYLVTRFMQPLPGFWMPSLWADLECQPEALSDEFWQATQPHRADFERLGFTACGLHKPPPILNAMFRESGGINYLDPSRRYFGQLHYVRVHLRATGQEFNRITLSFTAVYEHGALSCTNNQRSFDPPDENEVIRLDSFDAPVIYQRFVEAVQQRQETPRAFADVEALRHWFDERQVRTFEERVRRRLFVPMTNQEVTNARLGLPNPPASLPPVRFTWRQGVWLALLALLIALQVMRYGHHAGRGHSSHGGSGRADTLEYRGQEFKMRQAYATYEDYKDDPDNLDTNELERIEQTMVAAKVPESITDHQQFIHFLIYEMKFPGYGLTTGHRVETDDGAKLAVDSVEIPQRDKERYFVVRDSGGQFRIVDDFVYGTATNAITRVKLENGKLRYYDRDGHLLREKGL
jgi:hypothetical protein